MPYMRDISKRRSRANAKRSWRVRALCCAILAGGCVSLAAAEAPQSSAAAPLTAAQVLRFLDETIDWYRGLTAQQQIATTPTDLAILYDNRQAATQAVRLAFEFARAQAAYIVANTPASQGHSAVLSQYQSLGQLQARFDKQVKDTQAELDAARQKLATAGAKDRPQLQAQISELQGELDLANARRDAVHSMLEFVTGNSANAL